MKKLTYDELKETFWEYEKAHNEREHIVGYIVFTEDSFDKLYSLESRTYKVSSNCKAFQNKIGYSIFGSAIDGSDYGVRLDWYMAKENGKADGWKVDYCYLEEEEK